MMRLLCILDKNTEFRIEELGGKGLSLNKMLKKGYPVPAAAVLSTQFITPWIEHVKETAEWQNLLRASGDKIIDAVKPIKKICHQLIFSEIQKKTLEDLRQYLQKEKISIMAVRSSSPQEDLEGASFSGIYESVLGATDNTLEYAIKTCFASVMDQRVILYKQNRGFNPYDPEIAVIIQKQIASDISGVAFTINPINNCYDQIVINANYGLGTTVVDGSVTPDQWIIDKVTNSTIEKKVGNKIIACYLKPDEGIETKITEYKDEFCLSENQVFAIIRLANQIEAEYKKPMDIEWAYENGQLYLLQARPITGYEKFPPEMMTKPGEQKRLYFDALLTEQGLVENVSPCSEGIYRAYLKKSAGGDERILGPNGLTFLSGGRMYSILGNTSKLAGSKATITSIKNVDAQSTKILEDLGLKEFTPAKMPKGLIPLTLKIAFLNIKSLSNTLKANWKPAEYLNYFLEENKNLKSFFKNEFEKSLIFEDFTNLVIEQITNYLLKISLPTLYATLIARSKIKKMFKKESQEIRDRLVFLEQAFPNNITIDMGLFLYELSQCAEISHTKTTSDFLKKLKNQAFSPDFLARWFLFMELYGFRCPGEFDIATPRYYEEPEKIFTLLKNMRTNADPESTPQGIFERGIKKREETRDFFIGLLKSKGKKKTFLKQYKILELFTAYRETHKYYHIMGLDYIRRKLISLAGKWVDAGRLDSAEQVFNLQYDQVLQAENEKTLDLRPLIKKNITFYGQFNVNKNPPCLFDSRGQIYRASQESRIGNELVGTPASPGIAIGPVKILTRADEKPVIPGDILVARATDPGWTILFLNAAGILIENGGTLQHGASVARESCKPCIVGIAEITSILKDGQIVELDGGTGVIRILE
jgi:rifampicin phosphotransferase